MLWHCASQHSGTTLATRKILDSYDVHINMYMYTYMYITGICYMYIHRGSKVWWVEPPLMGRG